ncbi:unnamed protein product [Adineta ricciae]|uniref:Nudix hydrolase domain-containing protein n=1 Tax=Adineta ricciae TaxID=249248 RepID=A0A813UFI6_ADIRI|nr:unnamed protein product [Adineta ricciae]CAF1040585.1 unnamed protein product [Adineta ricciae]
MASSVSEKYSGSGVLIVDTISSSVLLVFDYTKNYNCCGGYIKYDLDEPKCLEKTAQEELREETRTLFSCDLDHLASCPFVDVQFSDEIFRCYIYKVACDRDVCSRFEQFDLTELSNDHSYLETTSMRFFPLKQFHEKKPWKMIDRTSMGRDQSGQQCPLHRRVISVIKQGIQQKLL